MNNQPQIFLTHATIDGVVSLSSLIAEHDLALLHIPLVAVELLESVEIKKRLASISAEAVFVITSKNGVRGLLANSAVIPANKIFVIGEATAQYAKDKGLNVSFVGSGRDSLAFAQEVIAKLGDVKPRLISFRGDKASTVFSHELRKVGIEIEEVVVYRSTAAQLSEQDKLLIKSWIVDNSNLGVVAFTSPLAVKVFAKLSKELAVYDLVTELKIAVIGEITHKAAVESGFAKIIVSQYSTMPSLAITIVNEMVI